MSAGVKCSASVWTLSAAVDQCRTFLALFGLLDREGRDSFFTQTSVQDWEKHRCFAFVRLDEKNKRKDYPFFLCGLFYEGTLTEEYSLSFSR